MADLPKRSALEGGGETPTRLQGDTPTSPVEDRVIAAWQVWLSALATDPEAALAAALAYEALDDAGRALWLDALDQDAPAIQVPRVAIYGPLLWVETDPSRRARIATAMGSETGVRQARVAARALHGVASERERLVVLVLPLHLDFVQVLACKFSLDDGFEWVRHDPIVRNADAPAADSCVDGIGVELVPLKPVIEELAHAVVAHRRSGRPLPDALKTFVDLFDPTFDEDAT